MLKKVLYFPSRHLSLVVLLSMAIGLVVGNNFNAQFVRPLMPLSILAMVLPTMIGFNWKEMASTVHTKLFVTASVINFLIIPSLAYVIGIVWLQGEPELFAGLALASLLPTSGMTISWTMLYKGNVSASIKITAISLIIGALITPLYLTMMFSDSIEANLMFLIMKVFLVILLPMVVGARIYRSLLNKYSMEQFNTEIKPMLPAISSWGLVMIIFVMTSINGNLLIAEISSLIQALIILVGFYSLNFLLSTFIGKWLFNRADTISLVYSTVLRNLSIAIGIAVISFGPKAALILALAFVLQIQFSTWYGKLTERFRII